VKGFIMKTNLLPLLVSMLTAGPLLAQQSPISSTALARPQGSANLGLKTNESQSLQKPASEKQMSLSQLRDETAGSSGETKSSMSMRDAQERDPVQEGGSVPGGQGLLRINGILKTLIEAGFIFDRAETPSVKEPKIQNEADEDDIDYYRVSEATKIEVERLVAKLSVSQFIARDIYFGSKDTLILRHNIKAEVYKQIRSDYKQAVQFAGYDINSDDLILPAFSPIGSGKTYILPAFDELKPHQQALVLFHEYSMRRASDTSASSANLLLKILRLDDQVYKYMKVGKADSQLHLRLLRSLADLRFYGVDGETVAKYESYLALQATLTKLGRPLFVSELALYSTVGNVEPIDPLLRKVFRREYPEVAPYLEPYQSIEIGFGEFNYNYGFTDCYNDLFKDDGEDYKPSIGLLLKVTTAMERTRTCKKEVLKTAYKRLSRMIEKACKQFPHLAPKSDGKYYDRFIILDSETELILGLACEQGSGNAVPIRFQKEWVTKR